MPGIMPETLQGEETFQEGNKKKRTGQASPGKLLGRATGWSWRLCLPLSLKTCTVSAWAYKKLLLKACTHLLVRDTTFALWEAPAMAHPVVILRGREKGTPPKIDQLLLTSSSLHGSSPSLNIIFWDWKENASMFLNFCG